MPSVHGNTLEVYKAVFDREIEMMKKDQNAHPNEPKEKYAVEKQHSKMALFLGGLFSFYQHASYVDKQKFLSLIKE